MQRYSFLKGVVCLLFVLCGCAQVRVSQDYAPGVDFAAYRTYDWKVVKRSVDGDVRANSPLLHDRFHRAIDQVLGSRGYARRRTADMLVDYSFAITTQVESYPASSEMGFGFGHHHHHGGIGFGFNTDVRQYDVGILVIDLYDSASDTLIWRGTGSEIVTIHSTPEKTTAMVYRLVQAILAQFPPP